MAFSAGEIPWGWLLCLLALGLTLSLPLTVAQLGELDWGPQGGASGSALGVAYLAIGLCVSSRTNNQIVAPMLTLVVGGLFYGVGTPTVTDLVT